MSTASKLDYWPTRDGVHIVAIEPDHTIRCVGVLWLQPQKAAEVAS